ncbi:hypothetical protein Tco_0580268 [Tanacetum coccineum]
MEEILYKFIDEGRREHDEMRAFICEFRTTNEILFKERNNSLSELRFEVQELLRVIDNTPMSNGEIKGVTTRGGKTTTQDVQNNNANIHTKEPLVVNHDKPVELNEILTNDQPQNTNEPVFQPSSKQLNINLPFIEALAQMPKYAKFLKGLLTNRARLEEACTITMNERCSAVLLNKLPAKEKDPWSFTIPCDIGQLHTKNALADLGASISLMPYTMYEKLGLGEPKAIIPIDFVILDMPEESKVPINLGRSFLATARAMIYVINKKITLRVPIRLFDSVNTPYPVAQETAKPDEVKSEHLYSASAYEIDEKKPGLNLLPQHLEYAYMHGDKSIPVIISSKLSEKEKMSLLQVLEKCKGAIAWKMSDIKGISPSYYTYNILMEDDYKPVIQPQRRLNPKVQDVVKNEIVK